MNVEMVGSLYYSMIDLHRGMGGAVGCSLTLLVDVGWCWCGAGAVDGIHPSPRAQTGIQ